MDYSNIETFLAIAETRSLSKAAEVLFLSQSTVSYRLKTLEQEIGAELIKREQGKGFINLTAKGEEFTDIAKRWIALYKDTEVWKTKKTLYGLNIGGVDSLNTCIFNELYKAILKNDTQFIINVSSHWTVTIYKMIENHEIDVGFVLWELPYKNIACRRLFSERMVLISSYCSGFPEIIHPLDLDPEKEIFMYHGPSFQMWHDDLWKNRSARFSTVDTVSLLSSFTGIPDFWSIVPISAARKLCNNDITISEIADSPPERACYQVINKHLIPNKLKSLEVFNSILQEFLNGEAFNSIIK